MFRSVGIVIVGDKILEEDTNGIYGFLKDQLNCLKYEVEKLTVLVEVEIILLKELNTLSKEYDILIIVGKLENEIVFKTLGNLASDVLRVNNDLKTKCKCEHLSKLPSVAKLLTNETIPYPVIYLQRMFILKEEHVKIQFLDVLKSHLKQYATPPVFKKKVKVRMNGNTKRIVDYLGKLVDVEVQRDDNNLVLEISNVSFENIVRAEEMLKNELHDNFLESNEDMVYLRAIYDSRDEYICKSLEVIEKCISTYGPDNVFLSFNGGKDCTVLLHLVYTVLKIKYPEYKKPIFCLYVKSQEPFPEQDIFISQCEIFYNLEIRVVSSSIKDALEQVLTLKPNLKACLMGTRRMDPYSENLNYFQMTDSNWPQIMRVSPLLEWRYTDIWDYLLFYKIPYCKLYDLGFTSIGSASNTIRNPSLIYVDPKTGREVFLPAYKLLKESEERSGRNVNRS